MSSTEHENTDTQRNFVRTTALIVGLVMAVGVVVMIIFATAGTSTERPAAPVIVENSTSVGDI